VEVENILSFSTQNTVPCHACFFGDFAHWVLPSVYSAIKNKSEQNRQKTIVNSALKKQCTKIKFRFLSSHQNFSKKAKISSKKQSVGVYFWQQPN